MTDYTGTAHRDTAAFVLRVIGWTLVIGGVLVALLYGLITANVASIFSGMLPAVFGAVLILVTRFLRDR
jgi:hypothetical protein